MGGDVTVMWVTWWGHVGAGEGGNRDGLSVCDVVEMMKVMVVAMLVMVMVVMVMA